MNWAAAIVGLAPEHALLAGIVLLLVWDLATEHPRGTTVIAAGAVLASLAAAVALAAIGLDAQPFPGQLAVTPAVLAAKAVVLALALLLLFVVRAAAGPHDDDRTSLATLLLSSLLGLLLLLSAQSFVTLLLAVETMSLPVYAMLLLGPRRAAAPEAALKYLVLGGTATACLLMGAALVAASNGGDLSLAAVARAMAGAGALPAVASALLLAALFVKAAVVPFHAWAPDAYDAASLPVVGHMGAIVKAGALFAAWRLVGDGPLSASTTALLTVLPLASIVGGNLAAMRQPRFGRLLGWSSVAHAGVLFLALLGHGAGRLASLAFYVAAYGVTMVLAVACAPQAEGHAAAPHDGWRGLARRRPWAAAALALALLSLAGIPPLPGFVAKFLIFREVMAAGHPEVAVLGLLGSYVGLYAYLRWVQAMYFGDAPAHADAPPGGEASTAPTVARSARLTTWVALGCVLAALALMVAPARLLAWW